MTANQATEKYHATLAAAHTIQEYTNKIIETIHEPLLVLDPDLRVQLVNPAFYTTFQVEPEASLGRYIYELGNGQWNIPALRVLLEDVLPNNKVFQDYAVTHTFEHLGERTMLLNARRLNHIQFILLAIEDITERQRAEQAQRALEQRQRLILESARDYAIFTFDLARRVNSWNTGAQVLCGYTETEIIGQSADILFVPEDQALGAPQYEAEKTLQEGIAENERWHRRKDGSLFWGSGLVRPLQDDQGAVIGFLKIMRDLTEQKQAEEALRESEARQAFLLKLTDALRPLTEPVEIQATASRVLGEHLGTDRAYYVEIDEANREFVVAQDWHQPGVPSHARRYPLEDWPMPWLSTGNTWVVHDVDVDPALPDDQRAAYGGNDIGAAVVVPLIKENRLVATFVTNQRAARAWVPYEIALVEETAERTWAAVERARAEAALRANEARQATVLETMAEGVVTLDIEGRFVSANAAAERILGLPRADLIGRSANEPPFHRLTLEGAPRAVQPSLAEVEAAGDHIFHDNYIIERRDGSQVVITRNITALRDKQGVCIGFISTITDINERVQAEIAVRESETRFRTLTDVVPQIIWTNEAMGKALYFNQRWYGYSGLSYEQSLGLGWQAIVHPEDAPASVERWQQALAVGEVFDTEYRLRRADGVYRWHIGRNVPLRNEHGHISGWFGSATDIEDMKQAEAALRTSEERFRLLVEGAHDYAMLLLDPDHRITFWSVGAARVFGWSEAEALGQSAALIFTPEDRGHGALEQERQTALATGSAADRRWHMRKDNTRLFVDGVLIRLDDETGRLRGFAKIGRDATVQRQAEEALLQLNVTLEQRVTERTAALVASEGQLRRVASLLTMAEQEERQRISQILHDDLQQQLYGIQMQLSLARQDAEAGELAELLTTLTAVEQWINQGIQITRQLTVELSPPVLQYEGLVAMLGWLNVQMKQLHGLDVTIVAEQEITFPDKDMRVLLFQILRELLFNVVKHAATQQATVALRHSENELIIAVSDDGRGFNMEEGTAHDEQTGGFGLFSIRERLGFFGGRMAVVSAPGAGTQVTLTLPMTRAARDKM